LKTFGPKREDVAGGWRRLQDEELHNLYAFPNIIQVIKSRRVRWVGQVALNGRGEKCIKYFGWKTQREDTIWKTPGIDVKLILEWISGK